MILDARDTATDVFNTISDGDATDKDTSNAPITGTGINDDPVAVDDTDSANEDATITKPIPR